jgi:undecaprenyl-diphosphatase
VPVLVALSRLYRGMHYPSDVMAGALLAAVWLAICARVLLVDRR